MSDVIDHAVTIENLKQASAIRLEIDYELVTLSDAIKEDDEETIRNAKEKLRTLVENLKALSELVEE